MTSIGGSSMTRLINSQSQSRSTVKYVGHHHHFQSADCLTGTKS